MAIGFSFACNDRNIGDVTINAETAINMQSTDTSQSRFAEDLDNLRLRIKSRIQELDNQN